ncbi:MAG TPA: hypothetical protein VNZ22_08760 [Bacillota bacterium]|nr:hypothetical protein [Bacillota bacterium]
MRKIHLIQVVAALVLVAALFYGPPVLEKWRLSTREKKEQEWIQKAVRQLEQAPSPSRELGRGTDSLAWITSNYLIFSNGWAAYKMHSFHANDGMGDIALLRGPDGVLYSSRFHFCGGIISDFRDPANTAEKSRPKDLKDFLQNYATSWRPFSGS